MLLDSGTAVCVHVYAPPYEEVLRILWHARLACVCVVIGIVYTYVPMCLFSMYSQDYL